jgi:acyl dehydratase
MIRTRERMEGKMGGKYFEELSVGDVFKHEPGRTITETDNLLFTVLTMNPQPLHLDAEFAGETEFEQRLVNSIFTLGLTVGLSVSDTTLGTTVGNLGFEKVEFPKPVFIGDTLYAETEVVAKRDSRSRPQWGIVTFEHRARNQRGETAMCCRRTAMMQRREAAARTKSRPRDKAGSAGR